MGGLMIYGIPSFKLEKDVVERRTSLLARAGILFHTNFEVGRDASLADLRARHDAVLLAPGIYKARDLTAPGSVLRNIMPALAFPVASTRQGLGDEVPAIDHRRPNAPAKGGVGKE